MRIAWARMPCRPALPRCAGVTRGRAILILGLRPGPVSSHNPQHRVDRNMYVAVCQLTARIYGSRSLKDKRRVVQSLKERARKRFGASVSEVGQQEKWQIAVLGVAITSGEATHARQQLDALIRYVEEFSPELEVTGSESDVFSFGD